MARRFRCLRTRTRDTKMTISRKHGLETTARALTNSCAAMGLALVLAMALSGQASPQNSAAGKGKESGAAAPSGPAPVHDLTGIWMMHNPPGSNRGFTNYTYTNPKTDPPALTAWGEEKLKEAKDSNGGAYTLDQTNDPVLTKCDPPGLPRVYFHPYPFEFVQTPKFILMLYEYDHTVRRIYIDGRPVPADP